jgi:nucleoside-diphosphate-sugar epimerase
LDVHTVSGAALMRKALDRHPDAIAIVPHLGADEFEEYEAMLADYANLYLDTAMAIASYFPKSPDLEMIRRHPDRILYGTDYPTEDGSCVRDYIHVSDLVAAHVKALERLIEKPDENLVLNLGYGRGLSVLEVLDALDRLLPEPIRREMKGRRAGDPPLLISSNEALKATLDWQARYADIDTILTHALEWERKLLSRNWA